MTTHASENLTAILGPTNTGKTHLAIERMLGHKSGMIGLPLRLLAREVYARTVERAGADAVALITGEEKIKPADARYYVCTVEAMPSDLQVAFVAIDEVQLAADYDRGHVFTDRVLNFRGTEETLLLGAGTFRPLTESLLPHANILSRPRLSQLSYAGQCKLTRLPRRSAIVAFSADEVYAIAELVRRQRGGTAVVLGALSPRTRNAQVGLYQAGEVDYLVATDAIGMGLNLDIDHVAFAADRKFDGRQFRELTPEEIGQVAGRAGRHMRDGTFGVTGRVQPFGQELVERLEAHRFDPVKMLQWRSSKFDFASLDALTASLAKPPRRKGLTRALPADDERALDWVCRDAAIRDMAADRDGVRLLWEVCQVPDYRKIAPADHAHLVASIFTHLRREGHIPDDWLAEQVAYADRNDGDIDTLSNRIAHVRTWTFVANRPDWLKDPAHWQERTRAVEDRLSDALHECLTQRFVDRRTSVLARRLRDNEQMELTVKDGEMFIEDHHVGRLEGFRFTADPSANGTEGKALRAAALKSLTGEYAARAERLAGEKDKAFALTDGGDITWNGELVGRVAAAETPIVPRVDLIADEQLQGADRTRVQERLEAWMKAHCEEVLAPLAALNSLETENGNVRGLAFRLVEGLGNLDRAAVAADVGALDQEARGVLRKAGVRFGAYTIYSPGLLKPAATKVLRLLWALGNGGLERLAGEELRNFSREGLMSVPADARVPADYYACIGYRLCGARVVRFDMLERLADTIRPLAGWRPEKEGDEPPEGALGKGRFAITPAMLSLVGCSGEDFASVLRAMGFRRDAAGADGGQARPEAPSEESVAEAPTPEPDAASEETPAAEQQAGEQQAEEKTAEEKPAGEKEANAGESLGVWRRQRPQAKHPPRRDGKAGEGRKAPRKGKFSGAGQGDGPGGRGRRGPPGKPGKGRDAHRHQGPGGQPPRRPKQADPLSPFAALAGLKKELETDGEKS